MLIATAHNITPDGAREDGTADYDVWIGINRHCIWRGSVNGHIRATGAAVLLRLIADRMDIKLSEAPRKRGHSSLRWNKAEQKIERFDAQAST